jgi:hypothetical protein
MSSRSLRIAFGNSFLFAPDTVAWYSSHAPHSLLSMHHGRISIRRPWCILLAHSSQSSWRTLLNFPTGSCQWHTTTSLPILLPPAPAAWAKPRRRSVSIDQRLFATSSHGLYPEAPSFGILCEYLSMAYHEVPYMYYY